MCIVQIVIKHKKAWRLEDYRVQKWLDFIPIDLKYGTAKAEEY